MTRAWFSLTVLLATAGLLCWAAEVGTAEKDAAETAGLVIGEPIREGNLTIFPVISKTPKPDDRFITLDEGLRSGKVEILEVGALAGGAPGERFGNQPALARAIDPFGQTQQTAGDDPFGDVAVAPGSDTFDQAAQVQEEDPFGGVPAAPNLQALAPSDNSAESPGTAQEEVVDDSQQVALQYSGNDVNRLMVVNRSEKPLYLMPGEVIVGGDQDRTIGRELVIAPTGKPTPISVFCVEHGRWGSRNAQQYAGLISTDLAHTVRRPASAANVDVDSAADSVDLEELTASANSGKFIGSIGSLNKGARLAVQKGEGQGEVWNQVSMQNSAAGVRPASGAFTENYASEDVVKRLDRYQEALENRVSETENVVGVIVAVNGKVESMDVFESTPLFTKLWPKLLKSYALDALNKEDDQSEGKKKVSIADARRFMNDVASANTKGTDQAEAGLATTQAENDRVLLFSAREQGGAAAMRSVSESAIPYDASAPSAYGGFSGGLGGGLGGGVHTSAFSK